MTQHKVGSRDEWLTARNELLERVPKGRGEAFRAIRRDEYEDATP
jgi:predicted dithiol-disulfide oxidoreductase (DUF899 family)